MEKKKEIFRKKNFRFDQKWRATTTKSFTLITHLSFFERKLVIWKSQNYHLNFFFRFVSPKLVKFMLRVENSWKYEGKEIPSMPHKNTIYFDKNIRNKQERFCEDYGRINIVVLCICFSSSFFLFVISISSCFSHAIWFFIR